MHRVECLQQWMKVNIPGDMCLAITELLISVHEGREMIEESFPHSVSQAVLNQMSMGRHMLQWGILSKQWRCIVQEYLQGTRKSTFKVLATLCNKIYAVTEKLSKNRCDEEHNNENSLINNKRSQKADEDIDKIYEGLPSLRSLPMVDRAFFKRKKKWRKKQKLKDKMRWVRRAEIILKSYESVGEDSCEARLMRRYLLEPD